MLPGVKCNEMKAIGQQMMWLWGMGCFLCATVAGAEVDADAKGRALGERWFHQLSGRLVKKPQPVINLPGKLNPEPEFRFPMLTTPPPTGPLSFAWALGTGFTQQNNPGNFNFPEWLVLTATPIQKERHKKIIADLKAYMMSRGYNKEQAQALADQLFQAKFSLYFPLIRDGQPNLEALATSYSPNPYSRSPVRNTATDYYNLGLMCQKVGNFPEAAKHYTKAARTQYPQAQASLGYLHETGQGVPRNLNKALELYQAAAKQGHSVAQYNLGRIYQHGLTHGLQSIPRDVRKAEQYLQRASAQGIVAAYHQLGVLYYSLGLRIQPTALTPEQFAEWDKNNDKIVSPDENRLLQDAHDHFLMAANQNHGQSQYSLGVMYYSGQGVPKSDATAASWLEKAAAQKAQKIPDSLYNLAQLYERGEGVRMNLTRAFILYREAAELGHAPAMYNYGLFFYQKREAGLQLTLEVPESFVKTYPAESLPAEMVKLNPEKNAFLADAMAIYRKEAGKSNQKLELLLPGGQPDFAKAVLAQLLAAAKVPTMFEPQEEQLGGDDPVTAYAWWKLAADRGQVEAQKNLEVLRQVLSPEQLQIAETLATTENGRINANPLKAPSPLVQAKSTLPFQAKDWSTGFFVSEDGYVVTGKHMLHSGTQFQVVTENGTFPAKMINLPGDLDQYLLLKVEGDYQFTPLRFSASHSTRAADSVQVLGYQMPRVNQGTMPNAAQANTQIERVLGAQADPRFFTLQQPVLGDQVLYKFNKHLDKFKSAVTTSVMADKVRPLQAETRAEIKKDLSKTPLAKAEVSIGYQLTKALGYDTVNHRWVHNPQSNSTTILHKKDRWVVLDDVTIRVVPPWNSVREGQALLRISSLPRGNMSKSLTHIEEVIAKRNSSSFTLLKSVKDDQVLYKFSRHLDKFKSAVASAPKAEVVQPLQGATLTQLKGALRTVHPLLGNAEVSIGYQLTEALGYDPVDHSWVHNPQSNSKTILHEKGRWVVLDNRTILAVPPLNSVREGQALLRISAIPGMVKQGEDFQRLYQLAEILLTAEVPGKRPKTVLEERILDAQFTNVHHTPGFRGTALLNQRGQAIGLFFPGFRGRTPDVFRNFSSYHQYLLKSDHLMAFLNRLPAVRYSTLKPELPKVASNTSVHLDEQAYLLAKAKASMVLVQVTDGLSVAKGAKGGSQP